MVVYLDSATIVDLEPYGLCVQSVRIRSATDGYQTIIPLKNDFLPFFVIGLYNDLLALALHGLNLGRKMELHFLLFQDLRQFLGQGGVHPGDYSVHKFHHRNFRTKAFVYLAKLHTDNAPSDYDKVLWNFL